MHEDQSLYRDPPYAPYAYRSQSVSELRLNLVEGKVDLGQFRLLQAGRLRGVRLGVAAGIIGASHVIRVKLDEVTALHEIFACADVVSDAPRAFSGSVEELDGRRELDFRLAGDLRYRFRPRITRARDGGAELSALAQRIDRSAGVATEVGLRHAFPRHGACCDPPETLVWVGLDPCSGCLRVETAHSYPNEGAIVFSDTRLEPDPG